MLFESEEEKKKFLYWFYQAQIWMRYSRGLDASLQADVNDLRSEKPFESLLWVGIGQFSADEIICNPK